MKRLSEADLNEIIKLYQEGVPPKDIGTKFGIYNNSVTRILKKRGIERNQLTKVSENNIKDIMHLYLNDKIQIKCIAQKFDLDDGTICRILKRNGIELRPSEELRRKYHINEDFFADINSEASAYFLGFFYADACLSNNKNQKRYAISITLKPEDRYILQKLSELIYGFDKTIQTFHKYGNGYELKEYYNLSFYSKKMYNDLIKFGCMPQKSFKITFPSHLIKNEFMSHFIRGYMDGDGCICNTNERFIVDFVSTNEFLLGLKEWSKQNLNIEFNELTIRHKQRDTNTRSMRISALDDVRKLLDYLYKDATLFLKRKKNIYDNLISSSLFKRNIKIDKISNISNYGSTYTLPFKDKIPTINTLAKISKEDKQKFADELLGFYRNNGFPNVVLNDDELIRQFTVVKNTDSYSILKSNNILTIFNNVGSNICKHFSPHFYDTKSGIEKHKPSIIEAFNNDYLLNKVLINRLSQNYVVNGNMLRQGLANSNVAFKASWFNILLAKFIYSKFTKENDIVYDYSMGFGQRLVGALSVPHSLTYLGTDPYKLSYDSNCKIYDFYSKNVPNFNKKADLNCFGSESFCPDIYTNKVNLAFSSPPYYNLEIYNNDKSQAYNNGYNEFINNYWRKTVANIDKMLVDKGLFVLNIKEYVDGFNLAEDMLNVAYELGYKVIDVYKIQLTKNLNFRNKDGVHKYEPIFILQKSI